ncbi:hypothetical protein L7F22_069184 [Adiantum nelumboides]|nr:hypothetical protein [Adiantum nelumboides]
MVSTDRDRDVPRPRRGRPRDRSKDLAVLDATVRLLAVTGIAGTSMDRVAAEAGVSKVTVYTRWASKSELIGAALTRLQVEHVPDPLGAVRDDLVAHLDAMRRQYDEVGGMAIIGNCLAEEPRSGELLATIRASTLLPRRALLAAVLRAGVERGARRRSRRRAGREHAAREPLRRPPRGAPDGARMGGRRRRRVSAPAPRRAGALTRSIRTDRLRFDPSEPLTAGHGRARTAPAETGR